MWNAEGLCGQCGMQCRKPMTVGMRVMYQIVRRGGKAWVWSRGEELVTERFPEIEALAAHK